MIEKIGACCFVLFSSIMPLWCANCLPSFSTAIASRLRHSTTLTVMKVLSLYYLSNKPIHLQQSLARGEDTLTIGKENHKQAQWEHAGRPSWLRTQSLLVARQRCWPQQQQGDNLGGGGVRTHQQNVFTCLLAPSFFPSSTDLLVWQQIDRPASIIQIS